MKRTLEEIVKAMKLVPIDDEYRLYVESKYEQPLDDKYKYRTVDGDHFYSIEYLLNKESDG